MCLESCFSEFSEIKKYSVYIDGNNMAYSRFNKIEKPSLSDILSLIKHLIENLGFSRENVHCICDPSLKYNIDKPIEYQALIKEGIIKEAPKIADEMILGFALKHEFCFIISNDRFRNYLGQLPGSQWLEERRVSFMIINDSVCLSPNISYKKIDLLKLNGGNSNQEEQIDSEITTLDILKRIGKINGELDLF